MIVLLCVVLYTLYKFSEVQIIHLYDSVDRSQASFEARIEVEHFCSLFYWCYSGPSAVRDCGTPNNTVNGNFSLSNGTVFNSIATYSCHHGFSLVGNATIECKPDGTWSQDIPLCIRKWTTFSSNVVLVDLNTSALCSWLSKYSTYSEWSSYNEWVDI